MIIVEYTPKHFSNYSGPVITGSSVGLYTAAKHVNSRTAWASNAEIPYTIAYLSTEICAC